MSQNSQNPRVLKVWGIQAARILETLSLIQEFKTRGPVAVILSAPNTGQFRTTNVLIEAATALAAWDIKKSKELLLSVKNFVLNTVCAPLHKEAVFVKIKDDIEALFQTYLCHIDFYSQERSPTARFIPNRPEESNDYVATVWKKPVHRGRGWLGTLHTVIPFIELWENISAITYSRLTNGNPVMSRSWLWESIGDIRSRVYNTHDLVISGALRLNPREKMLVRYWRWYTDANAGDLAGDRAELCVHKEEPVCSADPKIVWKSNSRPIERASLVTIRSSLHPLIRAQFLNPHVFDNGEPRAISVGDFFSGRVTEIIWEDIPWAFPLIQKGPQVLRSNEREGVSFWDGFLKFNSSWEECVVSVIDHSPRSEKRINELKYLFWSDSVISTLDERTASILVPFDQADGIVRQLHENLCEI